MIPLFKLCDGLLGREVFNIGASFVTLAPNLERNIIHTIRILHDHTRRQIYRILTRVPCIAVSSERSTLRRAAETGPREMKRAG